MYSLSLYFILGNRDEAELSNLMFVPRATNSVTSMALVATSANSPQLASLGIASIYGIACGGAIVVGTNAILYGTAVTTGAYTTSDGSRVFGSVDAVGAVSLGSNSNFNGNVIAQAAVNLGANNIGVFTGDVYTTGAVTLGAHSKLIGNLFACTILTLGFSASITGNTLTGAASLPVPASKNIAVMKDVALAYSNLMALAGGNNLVSSIAGTNLLAPGLYNQAAAWSLPAGTTLTFQGSATDTWIIQVGGAVSIGGNMVLTGGALASNIQWAVTGAITIGAGSTFYGTTISVGAVTVATGASLYGSVYSIGACTIGDAGRIMTPNYLL